MDGSGGDDGRVAGTAAGAGRGHGRPGQTCAAGAEPVHDGAVATKDAWQPGQYEQFAEQRAQPFHDLVALLQPVPGGRVVDFGCGSGGLTHQLHTALGAATTIGIDSSPAMLDGAQPGDGVTFAEGDLREVDTVGPVDVVFANASLQWVPDHRQVLTAWASLLDDGGQLAVQVPANVDHASHVTSAAVASESPFIEELGGNAAARPCAFGLEARGLRRATG